MASSGDAGAAFLELALLLAFITLGPYHGKGKTGDVAVVK